MSSNSDPNVQLAADIAEFIDDPWGFVLYAFPWGVKGTELEGYPEGPDIWHRNMFEAMTAHITNNMSRAAANQDLIPFQYSTTSGHGIGKSACLSWVNIYLMSTRSVRGVVTANTGQQLEGKTWQELAKWHRLAINKDWFKWTATKFVSLLDPSSMIECVPWSIDRTEAFAGLHNQGKCVLLVMDEASAIDDKIWEVSEGALTDKDAEIFWFAFGNPTRNTGRFRECFPGGQFSHRWGNQTVDSRTVKITNKRQIKQWQDDWGEDSDFFRVRVRGVFPRAGNSQFIAGDIAQRALDRTNDREHMEEVVVGVDVARSGNNESVILVRRGRRVLEREVYRFRGIDTMQLSNEVASVILRTEPAPDTVFIDGAGVGGGVVDRMRQLNFHVMDVQSAARADDPEAYVNKRAEMWYRMRDWLDKADLPKEIKDFYKQLIGVDYGFDSKNRIQLEKKEDLIKRGLESPDLADALALTFAYRVSPQRLRSHEPEEKTYLSEYDEYEEW